MTIVQRMRGQLAESMKARDAVRTQFLRYWIAGLTLGTGEEMPDADAIRQAPKEGMAMGIAMKTLAGQLADSNDVKAVIAELREDTAGA